MMIAFRDGAEKQNENKRDATGPRGRLISVGRGS
jgi:hypothetical protein